MTSNRLRFLKNSLKFFVCILFISCSHEKKSQDSFVPNSHPNLILTQKSVLEIRSKLGAIPLFDKTLEETRREVDKEILKGIDVPIPKDMAGGYTHTQHKVNYATMQKAGVLFQLLEDEKYAMYIKDMLMEYAKLFPTLSRHPQIRSYARGKLFWQCLNDSNWLVYTSQAYDCIYDWLSPEETAYLNSVLFRPYADFLSIETPQYFNRVHNHSTWGNVAVGMIGLVMDDEELINRALYGLQKKEVDLNAKDNDGGFIYSKDGEAGFLANLDFPFSPDGYYTEGPYYQRYAMYPFLIFAEALENKKPDLKIFEYKNGVLKKSVDALLNLTDADGEFFPLNDGQKGMSYFTASLVSAVDIAYYYGGKNPALLSIAKKQNQVQLDATGLAVAMGLKNGEEKPFIKKSLELKDGSKGDEGGLGIIRSNKNGNALSFLLKYSAQGLSHGHYDKLSMSLYENGEEVIQDYGLARFVNIEQKNGGGYLKENKTWAKQTIAHNTIIQNEKSHFQGKYSISSQHHSDKYVFDVSNPKFQVVSAKDSNAYPGTKLHRTMIMIDDSDDEKPYVLDVFRVNASQSNQYDLPYYYFGQIISKNLEIKAPDVLLPLGSTNGYQHLWKEGIGKVDETGLQFTWMQNKTFYSLTAAAQKGDEVILARIGANDPEYNLRKNPAVIFRKKNKKSAVFASLIESHGTYNFVTEKATNAYSAFSKVEVLYDSDLYTAIEVSKKNGQQQIIITANQDNSRTKKHNLEINNTNYNWVGYYYHKTKTIKK